MAVLQKIHLVHYKKVKPFWDKRHAMTPFASVTLDVVCNYQLTSQKCELANSRY